VTTTGVAPALTWVIGGGGLLGRSLEKALDEGVDRRAASGIVGGSGERTWRLPQPIDWSGPNGGAAELRQRAGEFLDAVGDRSWSVAWCAGAGVTASSADAMQLELVALRATLDALAAARSAGKGTFFFASSAGGVYAGVREPPYDESSPVHPLAAYGRAKLDGEAVVTSWSRHSGTPALIGRIANIYGPGQNLTKPQGLISQICRSQLTGQPLSIYVSLDTLRDYFFAPDCARLIIEGLARLAMQPGSSPTAVTKILASQRAITIGAVLGEMRRIFKNAPRIVLGASAAFQARDLSLRSRVWPELDHRVLTPFPVGVAATAADLLRRLQQGALSGL
jgi:UDP-glucose 4-epimerase